MTRLVLAALALAALAAASVMVGAGELSPATLLDPRADRVGTVLLLASRLPRTAALLLAGSGMAVCGTLMQGMMRNRFVEPATAGTVEAARLGMLAALIVAPGWPVPAKMLVAGGFAMGGTMMLVALLRRLPPGSAALVPLTGIMVGALANAVTFLIAVRFDMVQSVMSWTVGDFSTVLRGRYEVLWITLALTGVAYWAADRFTVAGLGESFAMNLGLDYGAALRLGVVIVSLVTAAVVVTAGVVPFVGLIVPNLISMLGGDHLRRTLPWTAVSGGALLLGCDLVGRLVIRPFEIPAGTILGVLGAAFFLLLLRRGALHAA